MCKGGQINGSCRFLLCTGTLPVYTRRLSVQAKTTTSGGGGSNRRTRGYHSPLTIAWLAGRPADSKITGG